MYKIVKTIKDIKSIKIYVKIPTFKNPSRYLEQTGRYFKTIFNKFYMGVGFDCEIKHIVVTVMNIENIGGI